MELNPNAISFIGLCNEYCVALENAAETERDEFIDAMLRLLPRIYISATDLKEPDFEVDGFTASVLDEDSYESVRRTLETLIGEDDIYLEVFEEDMKYSDTPVSASISEGLADLFQVMYNFVETIRDSTDEVVAEALTGIKEDFRNYWSATLCNLLRALNRLKMNS